MDKTNCSSDEIVGEVWKQSSEVERLEVSNFGRVRNLQTKKMLTGYNHDGYIRVSHKFVHRLVAKEFIPNPENKSSVNHIDGNKTNNHVENLEWCTLEENNKHAIEVLGSIERKLTIEQVEQLRQDVVNHKYKSLREICRKFNMNRDCISDILDNKTYKTETSKPVNIFKKVKKDEV